MPGRIGKKQGAMFYLHGLDDRLLQQLRDLVFVQHGGNGLADTLERHAVVE